MTFTSTSRRQGPGQGLKVWRGSDLPDQALAAKSSSGHERLDIGLRKRAFKQNHPFHGFFLGA